MARYTGPRNKLARREGIDLGLKTVGSKAHASLLRRMNITPGQHGAKRKSTLSGYGVQLREKQKARRIYGVYERQFKKYFDWAIKQTGNTGQALLQSLERRLDNVVYRLGLAPTRAGARQLVSHQHVLINGKKVSIPSYQVRIDEIITLDQTGMNIPVITKLLENKSPLVPQWLARDKVAGKVVRFPQREDIELDINEQLIVEYYSR